MSNEIRRKNVRFFIYFSHLVNQNSQKVLFPKEKGQLFQKDDSFPHGELTMSIKGEKSALFADHC